jgi:hypothetical protein
MQVLRPESILSYGVVGLGFLLALLAYRLLGREQQKELPNRSILVAIHVFMIFSAVLCVIGLGSEYLKDRTSGPDDSAANRPTARIAELEDQLAKTPPDPKGIPSAETSKARREEDVALAESMEALMDTRTVRAFITASGQDIQKHAHVIRTGIARLKQQQ